MRTEDLALRALLALEPVRDQLVIVGGTAHRLFVQHELAVAPEYELLTTEGVDMAAPKILQDLREIALDRSLEEAGFEDTAGGGAGMNPVHRYRWRDRPREYIQFIAHLSGSGERRDGGSDQVLRFGGLRAEKLRHVDVLFHKPWTTILRSQGVELEVQVANPLTYLLQKLLGLDTRTRTKQGKDALYLFDTLALFADSLDALGKQSAELAPTLTRKQTKTIRRAAQMRCMVESDATHEAAMLARGQRQSPPTSAQIAAACSHGLQQLFGRIISEI